ncbi:hypothetical protein R5W23_001586 [Gemmata sp. JC673]|uniref:Uncharacterized protein n=1 Tax=Gemmata algarum TaxID=2975278 RepID=A0ABU5F0G5_9BACT|nr:hypothetical protein [Gemmata algarum]MDY3560352.1 hypothetical protein [Gemmata algarum]
MKRFLLAAMTLGLAAGAASADWGGRTSAAQGAAPAPQLGGPNTVLGMGGPSNGVSPDPYGMHPRLKRLFRIGGSSHAQMGYGQSGPAYNPNGFPPGAYGPAQGTLVFPNHPFVRSPRDFFMLEQNR